MSLRRSMVSPFLSLLSMGNRGAARPLQGHYYSIDRRTDRDKEADGEMMTGKSFSEQERLRRV